MRLRFDRLIPSKEFIKELGRLGFGVTETAPAEIQISLINSLTDLHLIETNRLENQAEFFVFVAAPQLFTNEKFRQHLLTFTAHFVLLPENSWEELIYLHLNQLKRLVDTQHRLIRSETELEELNNKTNELILQFEKDLELANQIQKSLLPPSQINVPGISILAKYLPASGLGGDYFDIFELEDSNQIGFLMADSETHGMAAALLSALLKIRLEELRHATSFTQNLVTHLSDEITKIQGKKSGSLDFFFGILNKNTLQLEFTSAGLLRPLLWSQGNLIELPTQSNPALGISPAHSFRSSSYQLKPGDFFFLHSNGLRAPFAAQGQTIDQELSQLLKKQISIDPIEFQSDLLARISHFKEQHTELPDDVTWIQVLVSHRALYLAQSK